MTVGIMKPPLQDELLVEIQASALLRGPVELVWPRTQPCSKKHAVIYQDSVRKAIWSETYVPDRC